MKNEELTKTYKITVNQDVFISHWFFMIQFNP